MRGRAYFSNRNYENAIQDFSKAIDLNHQSIDCFRFRSYCYAYNGNFQNAIQDISRVISEQKSDNTEIDLYIYRAKLNKKINNYEATLSDYTYVIEKNPNRADIVFERGKIYFFSQKYTKRN